MTQRHVATLAGDPTAASRARGWLASRLGSGVDEVGTEVLEDVKLIVSELVTNAVQAGGGPVRLTLERSGDRLHLEVIDDYADALPMLDRAAPDASHGRGLTIVAALALDWGWHASAAGSKVVWADVGVGT
jgi:anti-sigma regulatory factor (Ser/Thr protein kinase)